MTTNTGRLKTEIDTMDRKPPITAHKHDLLTILRKASLFPETSVIIFTAVKNENVACLGFEFRVIEKRGKLDI